MEKETRNQIRKFVQDARQVLEKEMSELLEGTFGLHPDGTLEDISNLPQIRDDANAIKAREGFVYFVEREVASGSTKRNAVGKLLLGLSFTHLNRLVALKLMERRKVIRETVSRLTRSNGFIRYIVEVLGKRDFSEIDDIEDAYCAFILHQCRDVSEEIKILFDPEDLSSYVFPRYRALREVLEMINDEELAEIWEEDETIGWFYQYFTPKELRDKARAESKAPRNSYELAFRNQFYTPRYVVQFLTDNTLGRTWYEMRQGDTSLTEKCQYLVRHPNEIFLVSGEKAPDLDESTANLSQEELLKQPVYIPHRPKKDPREIKILDPAWGRIVSKPVVRDSEIVARQMMSLSLFSTALNTGFATFSEPKTAVNSRF